MNGREAQRLGSQRAAARRAEREALPLPELKARKGPRATGTNPRKLATNPRALATNPTAGLDSDAARVARQKRAALARHRVRTGEPWCSSCDDTGWLSTPQGVIACPTHQLMTATDAYFILHPMPD